MYGLKSKPFWLKGIICGLLYFICIAIIGFANSNQSVMRRYIRNVIFIFTASIFCSFASAAGAAANTEGYISCAVFVNGSQSPYNTIFYEDYNYCRPGDIAGAVGDTDTAIDLDSIASKYTAYEIGGGIYFRIRDIAEALNISIKWNSADKTVEIDTSKPYITEPAPVLLAETADMGQEYIDSIVFLGDSTTYGLRYYGVLNGGKQTKQVWTPSSGTLSLFNQSRARIKYPETGLEIPIEEAVALKKPEYIVITLGVNGVSSMSEEAFKKDYKALISRIQNANADTKIILNSIYPIARSYAKQGSINNTKITRANGWVYEIAEEMGVRYSDSASVLKDNEGWLIQSYQNGDGLHLTGGAFRLVLDYLRTHGYQ